MKIVKSIKVKGEGYDELVAYITGGKKPMVYVCEADDLNPDYDFGPNEQIDDTSMLNTWYTVIPLSELRKIARVRLPAPKKKDKRR